MSKTTTEESQMTASQTIQKATELENAADMLDSALLAPSMKSDSLRAEVEKLREAARAINEQAYIDATDALGRTL